MQMLLDFYVQAVTIQKTSPGYIEGWGCSLFKLTTALRMAPPQAVGKSTYAIKLDSKGFRVDRVKEA